MKKTWAEKYFKNKYLGTPFDKQMFLALKQQEIKKSKERALKPFQEEIKKLSATTLQATIRRRTAQNIKKRRFRFSILDESPKRQSLPTQLQPKQRPLLLKRQSLPTQLQPKQRPLLPTIKERRFRLCRNCKKVIAGRESYCANICELEHVLKNSPTRSTKSSSKSSISSPSRLSPTSSTKSSSSKSSSSKSSISPPSRPTPSRPKKVAK
jgi:hypothetical protein